MNLRPILAALLLAGAMPLAHSQDTKIEGLVDEPVASVARQDDLASSIAQALNGDASLKQSKITVQPDEDTVLLTGVTVTETQRLKATKIAQSLAGDKQVVNTIASQEVVIDAPPPQSETTAPDQQT